MTRRINLAIAAALLLGAGGPAARPAAAEEPSGPPRPFVFTQTHHDLSHLWKVRDPDPASATCERDTWEAQCVPRGARVQIQLPGNPTVWTLPEGGVEFWREDGSRDTGLEEDLRREIVVSDYPNQGRYILPCSIARHPEDPRFECDSICAACCRPSPVLACPEPPESCAKACTQCAETCKTERQKLTGLRCPSEIHQFEFTAPQAASGRLVIAIDGDPPSPIPVPLAIQQGGGFASFRLTLRVANRCAAE